MTFEIQNKSVLSKVYFAMKEMLQLRRNGCEGTFYLISSVMRRFSSSDFPFQVTMTLIPLAGKLISSERFAESYLRLQCWQFHCHTAAVTFSVPVATLSLEC